METRTKHTCVQVQIRISWYIHQKSFRDDTMLGRYYEEFEIDIQRGLGNYSQLLLEEALNFISNVSSSQPYFLYWAPDSTHGPWYSSSAFLGSSTRFLTHDDFSPLCN